MEVLSKKRTAIYLPNVGKGGFIRRLEMEPSTNVELVGFRSYRN
jgi:hypothetical protein